MLLPRFLAILIIGGGYLIWNAIFKRYPFRKEYKEKPWLAWISAILIIIGQLIYIFYIFSKLFSFGEISPFILLFIKLIISALIILFIWKKYRG